MKNTFRRLFSITLSIMMLLTAFPVAEITANADSVGTFSIETTEVVFGKFKLTVFVENGAEIDGFEQILIYDSDVISATKQANPVNGMGDFSNINKDIILYHVASSKLIAAYNIDTPGQVIAAFRFSESLNTNDKVALYTVFFETKDKSAEYTDFTLYTKKDGELTPADKLATLKADVSDRIGDADSDGYITTNDARVAFRASVGLEDVPVNVDVDRDGEITASDARTLLRVSIGLETLYVHSAFDMPEAPDAVSSGKISVKSEKTENGTVKVSLVAKDYADFTNADWKLTYDPAVLKIKDKPVSGTGVYGDFMSAAHTKWEAMSLYNTTDLGEIIIGFIFKETLGTNDETVFCTVEFDITDQNAKETKISLILNNGATEDSIDVDIHNHSYTSAVTKEATCKEKGIKTFTCTVCKTSYTEDIPVLNTHSYTSAVTKEATCKEKGIKTFTCTVCETSYTEDIPVLNTHSYTSIVTKEATCKEKGITTLTCSTCGNTITAEIPMITTHKYASAVTKEATCKDKGILTFTCEICADSFTNEIPVITVHSFGEWTVTAPATYEKAGTTERTCAVCSFKETKEIAKLEYTEIILPENESIIAADKETILSAPGITIEELIIKNHGNITIKDKDGNSVKNSDFLKSGMIITLTDNNNVVIDTKTVIVPGDNNGDGEITASDARNALRASVELDKLNNWQTTASDLNEKEEGKLTAADARFILRASVGLEDLKSWISSVI